ncbi:MAG: RtcB family protein [Desulfobacteraceae bacterium]|nr:MAG: RtcB family protein [Desulfobacteraceae bacterium]
MKSSELKKLGVPAHLIAEAIEAIVRVSKTGKYSKEELRKIIREVIAAPEPYLADPHFGSLAAGLLHTKDLDRLREQPIEYTLYGAPGDDQTLAQMRMACRLPVAVAGALMADAHSGYGLPIGGVLATEGAVIPYAVGVDIACRMKMSILDLPLQALSTQAERLIKALEQETAFGKGACFKKRRNHRVMDEDWNFSPILAKVKNLAWEQLGTSGGGNHFVEYGPLKVMSNGLGLEPGKYLALLSHSGSRGPGNQIGKHYSRIAGQMHPGLPAEAAHLAWLGLDTQEGLEYWQAMELMGRYAAANHELIHASIARALGVEIIRGFENHHNFAWKETHLGKEVIVHRKGATPAGKEAIGIIPGSMATPAYVVRGKGAAASLNSASHGAGRKMSRTQAKKLFTWDQARAFLDSRGVRLLSGGLDEIPMAYKDIDEVMAAQADLVEILASFEPKIVKMAGDEGGGDE